jgi:biopolymer transport protein ExbD
VQLSRPRTPPRLISLVSMNDVLLIMLVFFMVTSTYLNLDMIPVAQSSDEPRPLTQSTPSESTDIKVPLMIRLGPDGAPYLRGQRASFAVLRDRVLDHVSVDPKGAVLILPSPRADTQSLVALMDVLTRAGVERLRILQLAEMP